MLSLLSLSLLVSLWSTVGETFAVRRTGRRQTLELQ